MSDPSKAVEAPAAPAAAPASTMLTDPATPNAAPDATAAVDAAADPQPPAADAETPDAKTDEAAKPPERVAPEKYEFTGDALDPALLGEFEGVARELKLSQEEAQTVVDRLAPKVAERVAAQQAEMLAQAETTWKADTAADKEIGGDALSVNLGVARKALDAFGTPELRALLEGSRLGNHPEVIRFMVRAGKAISEDGLVPGSVKPAAPARDAASRLYN